MANTFTATIVTPERIIVKETVVSLVAPGVLGSFGILANHSPLLSELAAGELKFRRPSGEEVHYAVGGGFLQVADNQVTVLADTAELFGDIDIDRARRARLEAQEALKTAQAAYNQLQIDAAEHALARADNRIRLGSS